MNINKNNIHVFPYPGDRIDEHPSLNYLFKHYLPTIESKVRDVLSVKTKRINPYYLEQDLPQNTGVEHIELQKNKLLLKNNLSKLSEILGDKKPIVLLTDGCFTNDLLVVELQEILGDDFDKYVDIVDVSYTDDSKNYNVGKKLYGNSITIVGGSYSDLEDVDDSIFEGDLAKYIKNVHNDKINSKLLGICWGKQLITSIVGFDEMDSARIKTTYKGPLQVGGMIGKLKTDTRNIPYNYRGIVNSITNNGKNRFITMPLTRTGHVDYNFLNSLQLNSNSLLTFLEDPITGSPLLTGTSNGNMTLVQGHLEIDYNRDRDIYEQEINGLVTTFSNTYGKNVENILLNNGGNKYVSLGQSFYSAVLLSQTNSIIDKYEYFLKKSKDEVIFSDINISQENINKQILDLNFKKNTYINNKSLTENLDNQGFLRMSTFYDWKVNRGLLEASEILGIDLENIIKEHKSEGNNAYIFRDWGAGNGKLLDEITKNLNIKGYGVSDFAYFDMYELLIKLPDFADIPRDILKIFVQELIENYKKIQSGTVNEKIKESMELVEMKSDSFKVSSMFSDKTFRFNDKEKILSIEDKEYLKENKERLEELKNYLKENFYSKVIGNFESMIFSDFNGLYIPNSAIKQVDFQVAIRSTCHVDGKDLEKILQDYVSISAKPGSIFFDNGLVRSDSGVSRIKEYKDLEKNNKDVKVYYIYDSNTSYITSAVILKAPFYDKNNIIKNLSEGYVLLDTQEIDQCDFFKIERFFRELMVFIFEDLKYNHNKNKEIVLFLKELSEHMGEFHINDIKDIIIFKINELITVINQEYSENYSLIDSVHFDFYLSKANEDIKQLFRNGEINMPEWFNKKFERKN
ncbi:MAG: hypothetical protein PHS49_06020 [Candidatus Gracilibacteria bacterium]|nr:hypothetical protein [Candidatus Gracilibacteria bacterium]